MNKGCLESLFLNKQLVFVLFGFIEFLDIFCSCRYELVLLNKTSYAPFAILFSVAIAFCKQTVSADDSKTPAVLSKNRSDLTLFWASTCTDAQALVLLDGGCYTKYVAKYMNKTERWVHKWRQRRDVRQGLANKPGTGWPSKVGGGVKKTIGSIKYI